MESESLDLDLTSLILETVDATRAVLSSIETTYTEGDAQFDDLTERLRLAAQSGVTDEKGPAVPLAVPAAPPQAVAIPQVDKKSCPVDDAALPPRKEILQERRKAPRVEDESARSSSAADANIRVGVVLLDKLMDLVGELVLTRNQILQFNAEREDAALTATSQRLNHITSELQEGVMKTRMQPIGVVWNNLPRVVRDMAVSLEKQIDLKMEGAETELDRTIIEAIKDPLIHLVRNACDHGIELPGARIARGKPTQGTLTLRAYHEGGQVNIEVSDDGAGIDVLVLRKKSVENGHLRPDEAEKLSDRETLNLIFLPGFSTVQKVTNLSGRGVGMDVVKSHIEKIGGVVDISSRPGQGTAIKIRIPLTLAIIPGLVITSGGERFVIPQVSLLELIRLDDDASGKHIEFVHGAPVYRRRGSLLPITYLNQVLGLKSDDGAGAGCMVVLQADDRQFGLVVDGINDTQEIVVKPLAKQLKGLTLYAGATIMGDGRVALILDVLGIGQRSGVFGGVREAVRAVEIEKEQAEVEKQRLLLIRAGSFQRVAVPLSLVARLEEFPLSAVEHAGGGDVIQYRERILPLVSLRAVLEGDEPEPREHPDPLQVVVFNNGSHSLGMVVDQILDVVEADVTSRQESRRKGLLGSGVVGKLVTDFLDLGTVIDATSDRWSQTVQNDARTKKILVADGLAFSRGMIRSGLEMAGYGVVEAANLDEVILKLDQQKIDVVVASHDLSPDDSCSLLSALQQRPDWMRIPVLLVVESARDLRASQTLATGFQDFQLKSDRLAILESVTRLASSTAKPESILEFAEETR